MNEIPADLMRTAELAAYEALKEDHREPPALWAALIHRAVAAVLPLHEQQVRAAIVAEQEDRAHVVLGKPELQHRLIGVSGDAHTPTERDLAMSDDWLPEVRHEVRDVYPTPWRPANG
jgi:hypothetical protein